MGTLSRDEPVNPQLTLQNVTSRSEIDQQILGYIDIFELAARVERGLLYIVDRDWLRPSALVPAGQLWHIKSEDEWDAAAARKFLLLDWDSSKPSFRIRPLTTVGAPA